MTNEVGTNRKRKEEKTEESERYEIENRRKKNLCYEFSVKRSSTLPVNDFLIICWNHFSRCIATDKFDIFFLEENKNKNSISRRQRNGFSFKIFIQDFNELLLYALECAEFCKGNEKQWDWNTTNSLVCAAAVDFLVFSLGLFFQRETISMNIGPRTMNNRYERMRFISFSCSFSLSLSLSICLHLSLSGNLPDL